MEKQLLPFSAGAHGNGNLLTGQMLHAKQRSLMGINTLSSFGVLAKTSRGKVNNINQTSPGKRSYVELTNINRPQSLIYFENYF